MKEAFVYAVHFQSEGTLLKTLIKINFCHFLNLFICVHIYKDSWLMTQHFFAQRNLTLTLTTISFNKVDKQFTLETEKAVSYMRDFTSRVDRYILVVPSLSRIFAYHLSTSGFLSNFLIFKYSIFKFLKHGKLLRSLWSNSLNWNYY